jgi:Family of unknown function (DUF6159)
MFARFSRSWALIKASGQVLKQDKELMVFPLCSAIASIILVASFIAPLVMTESWRQFEDDGSNLPWALMFVFYLVQYFIVFFFNAALVGAALIRLDGGDPTVADGFRIARGKVSAILGYAAIAATIGLILRIIEERAGFIGRWIAGLFGIAFTVATFLAVPLLVSRDIGPIEAVKESAALLKRSWGENIIGNAGIGIVFTLLYLCVGTLGLLWIFVVANTGNAPIIVGSIGAIVLAVIALGLVHSALQGVYAAALYRYIADGEKSQTFSDELLKGAFKVKV